MTSVEVPTLERKLVAILAADVVGYSRLMHENEERTLATLTSHRKIIDALIATGNGEISGTAGDSVLAEFPSVIDALDIAVAIQQAICTANSTVSADHRMTFRIGINVGDVMVKDGGIFGDGVNVAARLEAKAEPGGICVTRGVRDHVRDRLDYKFEDLGEHAVKNIARPVRIFSVIFDAAGKTSGGDRSVKLGTPAVAFASTDVASQDTEAVELAFWESAQESGDPDEYRAYLKRFPSGAFISLAMARLSKPSPDPLDKSVELEFWNSIKDSSNSEMFEAYLEKYPDGEFKSLAEIRLAANPGSQD